jgi:hypothetical protein
MDPPDQPAGYFSTFPLDPSRSPETQSRPQKRNRRVFVCIPCHRRKLKCDKGQPCARCVMSDTPEECVYRQTQAGARRDHNADSRGAPHQSEQSSKVGPRLEGVTHWSAIAFEVRIQDFKREDLFIFQRLHHNNPPPKQGGC